MLLMFSWLCFLKKELLEFFKCIDLYWYHKTTIKSHFSGEKETVY